jgi:hypothetical protein
MKPSENDRPFEGVESIATASALIETSLHEARITVLHPTRLVLVGDGQRVRIDSRGVSRQALTGLRIALPLPSEALTDEPLQGALAHWAGRGVELHAHEVVRSGDRFARTLHLTDAAGTQATLVQDGDQHPAL